MGYLEWPVLTGYHIRIHLSLMTAGHTRCLVDGCFELLKRKFRGSDIFTLDQLRDVVETQVG